MTPQATRPAASKPNANGSLADEVLETPSSDKPIIDYSEISFGDLEEVQLMLLELSAGNQDTATLQKIYAHMRNFMARTVQYLPRQYFVKAAPAALDFADPSTYKWLRKSEAMRVFGMINNPEDQAGE